MANPAMHLAAFSPSVAADAWTICAATRLISLCTCCPAEDPAAAAERRRDEERERDRLEKEEFEQRLKEKDEVGGLGGWWGMRAC